VVLIASFVLMIQVYNFFELLSDIVRNQIAMSRVFTYLAYLAPKLIYDTLPVSVLVAVLVTFGVLTKHNEVTAFKACGVSLHRLAVPVVVMSSALSAGLFAFDHYYVPEANRKQDAIRNEIKGRPAQSYLRPDRKWIFGSGGSRIYYYKYFDTNDNVMAGVSVYDLDPKTFDLRREIFADRAEWQPSLHTWIFQNGWVREIRGIRDSHFEQFPVKTFAELAEPPERFRYGSPAGPVLQEIFRAGVCADHGDDFSPIRVPGGQPGRHGGNRSQHRNRHGVHWRGAVVRANRKRESAASGGGCLGARCHVRPRGAVSVDAHAELATGKDFSQRRRENPTTKIRFPFSSLRALRLCEKSSYRATREIACTSLR
jgi:hypothetical protein